KIELLITIQISQRHLEHRKRKADIGWPTEMACAISQQDAHCLVHAIGGSDVKLTITIHVADRKSQRDSPILQDNGRSKISMPFAEKYKYFTAAVRGSYKEIRDPIAIHVRQQKTRYRSR